MAARKRPGIGTEGRQKASQASSLWARLNTDIEPSITPFTTGEFASPPEFSLTPNRRRGRKRSVKPLTRPFYHRRIESSPEVFTGDARPCRPPWGTTLRGGGVRTGLTHSRRPYTCSSQAGTAEPFCLSRGSACSPPPRPAPAPSRLQILPPPSPTEPVSARARHGHRRVDNFDHFDLIKPSNHSREDSILTPPLYGRHMFVSSPTRQRASK